VALPGRRAASKKKLKKILDSERSPDILAKNRQPVDNILQAVELKR
jgi:hypothetical protein